MTDSQRTLPAIILVLIAALVLVFGLYVFEVAQKSSSALAIAEPSSSELLSQPLYEWTMVTTWPKNFPGLGTAPETFAKNVREMSNGRLKIKVHGAGEIVPALGVFDAVSSGSVELGHGAAYYWKGKIPAAPFFTAVPFGMNVQEINGWLHHGEGLALWREVYEPFNLIPFPAGNTGVQMGGWFNREINSVEDLRGLKMRIPGLGGEVLNRAGGTAVTIPGGELYTALQTGVIDATEWVGPYNDLAIGFHQVAKYYYYPGWHEPGATLELIVNKAAFASLPTDLQAIVEVAARAANQDMLDEYTARNNAALEEFVQVHGVDLRPFPEDVIVTLREISNQVYEEMAANDPVFERVYRSFAAFLNQSSQYHRISEQAYYESRFKTLPKASPEKTQ
ncbi:TRAP transporter substrate-binding protein [Marinibactrum halimedae]|uniref:C4-dicarboxylate ABC transporter n=1 Tax=Marinibactrum halimedae TaxID=1444977 RepID=A0AA37T702_9GAMM|nr:TRAP transporter substrate-binding protein DctP [Marinibactrum halimedae]MCD9459987.1 TRAP transporter substrate-binding protein DctP [Marinibactrum halimedae]GLS28245.1 C4-dicarboxylate ABC transporter [Marinibactrum halimedae]